MDEAPSAEAVETAAEQLAGVVRRIYSRGWCEGTSGNYSATLTRDPLRLLITRTGVDKGRIGPGDFLVLGDDNRPADGSSQRPSAESLLHLAVVRETSAAVVLHTHSVWGTLLGERYLEDGGVELRGYEMLKGLDGVRDHRETVWVPVIDNSQDMDRLSAAGLASMHRRPGVRGFLIAGHGLYTWGRNLHDAYRHVEIFEFLFQVAGRKLGLRA